MIEYLAKNWVGAKNDSSKIPIPNIVSSSNPSLAQMASYAGVDLGCSFDVVNHNINIIKSLEEVRYDLMTKANKPTTSSP